MAQKIIIGIVRYDLKRSPVVYIVIKSKIIPISFLALSGILIPNFSKISTTSSISADGASVNFFNNGVYTLSSSEFLF